jgi:hypothetical protein
MQVAINLMSGTDFGLVQNGIYAGNTFVAYARKDLFRPTSLLGHQPSIRTQYFLFTC